MNSAEDHEKAAEISSKTPPHVFENAAEISTNTPPHLFEKAAPPSAGEPASNRPASSPKQPTEQISGGQGATAGMVSVSGRINCLGSPSGVPVGEAHGPEDTRNSLQWIRALEPQVVGACRSDERLRPLLRWNVSCFGSDGRLLAHLGQHFKARELALLARCLCTLWCHSKLARFLVMADTYTQLPRGFLNLMLLPCSEMRLAFADDAGAVERVAVTIPGLESGGIVIEELKEDASGRTFALRDRSGKITNYFWQAEKLKSTGDELIAEIRTMLKRRPTLAHLTGIDEGRLDSFANYLRTAIFSKASSSPSPTQNLAPNSSPAPELGPSSQDLTLSTSFSQSHTSSFESSMEKLRRCVQEIDSSLCANSPLHALARILPATAQLIESLRRLRECLHALSSRRSNITVDSIPLCRKVPALKNRRLQLSRVTSPSNSALTVMYRNLGPTLDHNLRPALVDQALVNCQCHCPLATKLSKRQKPFTCTYTSCFGEFFTQVESQMPAVVPHVSNETVYSHTVYVLPFALEHVGDDSLHPGPFLGRQQRANLFTPRGCHNVRRLLSMPRNRGENGGIASDPGAGSGSRRLRENDSDGEKSGESSGARRRRCTAGAGLGNLVLVNVYAQETGPGLRVVTAEITSGSTFYVVRFLQSF